MPVIGFVAFEAVSADTGKDPRGRVLLALGIGFLGYIWANFGAPRMRIGSRALLGLGTVSA